MDESTTKVALSKPRNSITKRLILTSALVLANLAILHVLDLVLSWSSFLDWAPGVLFGLAFAVSNLKSRSEVISFTLLSGIAYWLAVEVAAKSAAFGFHVSSTARLWLVEFLESIVDVVTPFGVGGVTGAAILMVSLKFLTKKRLSGYDLLILLVGGVAGFAFGKVIMGYNFPSWTVYLIWQLPVALALAISLPGDSEVGDHSSPSALMDRISRFLQTPIFVIIGVILNLIALFEFFKDLVPDK